MVLSPTTKHLLLSHQNLTCPIRATQTTGPLQLPPDHQNVWDNGGTTELAELQIIRLDSYKSVFVRNYFKQVFLKAVSNNTEVSWCPVAKRDIKYKNIYFTASEHKRSQDRGTMREELLWSESETAVPYKPAQLHCGHRHQVGFKGHRRVTRSDSWGHWLLR